MSYFPQCQLCVLMMDIQKPKLPLPQGISILENEDANAVFTYSACRYTLPQRGKLADMFSKDLQQGFFFLVNFKLKTYFKVSGTLFF